MLVPKVAPLLVDPRFLELRVFFNQFSFALEVQETEVPRKWYKVNLNIKSWKKIDVKNCIRQKTNRQKLLEGDFTDKTVSKELSDTDGCFSDLPFLCSVKTSFPNIAAA